MARDDPQMKLRLSEELRALIADAAEANGRSMNAEITLRLQESFQSGIQEMASQSASQIVIATSLQISQMIIERARSNKLIDGQVVENLVVEASRRVLDKYIK